MVARVEVYAHSPPGNTQFGNRNKTAPSTPYQYFKDKSCQLELGTRNKRVSGRVDTQQILVEGHDGEDFSLRDLIMELKNVVPNNTQILVELKNYIKEMRADIHSVAQESQVVKNSLEALQTRVSDLEDMALSLQGKLEGLENQLKAQDKQIIDLADSNWRNNIRITGILEKF